MDNAAHLSVESELIRILQQEIKDLRQENASLKAKIIHLESKQWVPLPEPTPWFPETQYPTKWYPEYTCVCKDDTSQEIIVTLN